MIETRKTFCRFCHVFCGLEVDVEDNRVVAVRGDHDNPVSEGYTCPRAGRRWNVSTTRNGCAAP
jgi:anaerobic selenocysteine-containing dehydrogenase